MKLFNILIILSVFCVSNAIGQDAIQLIQEGNIQFDDKNYIRAIDFYQQAIELEGGDQAYAYFQLGECNRFIFDYASAEYNYQKSDEFNDNRYPLTKFYFASMLKLNGKYELALPVFETFLINIVNYFEDNPKLRDFYNLAKNEREGCILALTALSVPKPNYNLRALGSPVNTDYNDYAVTLVGSEDEIQVTSARKTKRGNVKDYSLGEAYTDVYSYSYNGSKWSSKKIKNSVVNVVNSKLGEGTGVYNEGLDIYYFTKCGDDNGCSLYYSKKKNGKWEEAKKLTRNVNARGYISKHPALSPSGDTLYFSSDRPGGFGGADIWMSFSSNGINWSEPKNLGKEINTPFNELSPFFDPIKRKLFFSSNGHRGFGGYDIYLANGISLKKTEIYNLGYPFNSNKDELFIVFGKTKGYLSSNRVEGPGKFDVFVFDSKEDKEVIAEISVEKAVAGRNAMFSDDLQFDSQEYQLINSLVSVSLAAKLQEIDLVLPSELQRFYDSLTIEDRGRIERIVNARYRKVTEEELEELEIENEYFYATSSKSDRKHITNMAMKYIEENGLSENVDYDPSDNEFYNVLDESDKRKVQQVISNRIRKAKDYKITTESYDVLNKRDKKNVDQIAQLLLEEKKSLDKLNLGIDHNLFIKSLSEEKKQQILESLKDKWLILADDPRNQLTTEDKAFYKNLSKRHLASIQNMANSFILSDADHLSQFLEKEDTDYYNILGEKQKSQVDKIIIKIIKNTYLSDLLYTESTNISKSEISRLKDNVSGVNNLNEMLASVNKSDAASSLDLREKNRLVRFLSSGAANSYIKRKDKVFSRERDVVEREYKELKRKQAESVSEKIFPVLFSDEAISEANSDTENSRPVAPSYSKGLEVSKESTRSVVRLDEETIKFYEGLPIQDKLKVDRFIAARYINKDYESAQLLNADLDFEKRISKEEKSFVKVLSKRFKEETLNKPEKQLLAEGFIFYNSQATNAKPKWNRIILSYALNVRSGGVYLAKRKDYAFYNGLSDVEKGYVKQIEAFRRTNHRIISDNIEKDSKDVILTNLVRNIPKYIVKTEKMSIEGELVDNKNGKAVESFAVALENESGKQVYQTNTNKNGEFAFNSIDSDQYKLVSASSEYAEKFNEEYFIKDLSVKEVNENEFSYLTINTVLFFDSDAKSLRNEAKVSLDEIAAAYKKSNFNIELDSHTDDEGNKSYNEKLSKDRGFNAKDYLVSKGVNASDVVIRFYGSEKPVTSNDNVYGKQFNRRVDVIIKSVNKLPYNPALVYLAKPSANLEDLAKRYKITPSELRNLNGLGTGDLKAYQPVRLPNVNISPDLTQVVPLNMNVLNLSSYMVRKGDSVTSIADKLRIPEELIYELNNLTSDNIEAGTKIIVLIRDSN